MYMIYSGRAAAPLEMMIFFEVLILLVWFLKIYKTKQLGDMSTGEKVFNVIGTVMLLVLLGLTAFPLLK
ncbi:MAG: hypothetical protein IJM44_08570 [Ruminococcus sp.]|nr:hypothetical protein [Ruminococcus sp.]